MAINVSVQYNGGFLLGMVLLTLCVPASIQFGLLCTIYIFVCTLSCGRLGRDGFDIFQVLDDRWLNQPE